MKNYVIVRTSNAQNFIEPTIDHFENHNEALSHFYKKIGKEIIESISCSMAEQGYNNDVRFVYFEDYEHGDSGITFLEFDKEKTLKINTSFLEVEVIPKISIGNFSEVIEDFDTDDMFSYTQVRDENDCLIYYIDLL